LKEINKTRKIKFSAEDEKRTYRPSEGLDEANQPIEFNISPPSADNSTSEEEDRQETSISRAYRPTMVMKSNKVEYVETAPMAKVAFQGKFIFKKNSSENVFQIRKKWKKRKERLRQNRKRRRRKRRRRDQALLFNFCC
jgi:hypothetical protein